MLSQIDLFHDCFDQVDDPRVPGRTTHLRNSIQFLVVAAMIADAIVAFDKTSTGVMTVTDSDGMNPGDADRQ